MQHITEHAQIRSQQRGILPEALGMVLRYGNFQRVRGGKSYYMDKQAHQRARLSPESDLYLRLSDRLNFYVVVSTDDSIVTVAHSYTRRPRRHRKRRYNNAR